jgi:hypothetical protein
MGAKMIPMRKKVGRTCSISISIAIRSQLEFAHGFGRQDGLPCLEPLLLEGGIWRVQDQF